MTQRLAPLLLITATIGAGLASESGHSIRLGLQGLPTDYETETSVSVGAFSGTGTDEHDWEGAGRFTLGYRWTPDRASALAFGLGVGLAFSSLADDDGTDLEVAEAGAWIEPALIWRPLGWLELEAGVHVGAGQADAESEGGFDYDPVGYGEAGITLRAVFVLRQVELMLAGGWLSQGSEFDWENDGLGVEGTTEVTTAGGWAGIGIGIRL